MGELTIRASVVDLEDCPEAISVSELEEGVLYRKWDYSCRSPSFSVYFIKHFANAGDHKFIVRVDQASGISFWNLRDFGDSKFVVAKDLNIEIKFAWRL